MWLCPRHKGEVYGYHRPLLALSDMQRQDSEGYVFDTGWYAGDRRRTAGAGRYGLLQPGYLRLKNTAV